MLEKNLVQIFIKNFNCKKEGARLDRPFDCVDLIMKQVFDNNGEV